MHNTLVGQLTNHIYCLIDSQYTHKVSIGFIPVVWFGLVSYPGRVWGCTVMLESGAIFRNLPPHAIAFREDAAKNWEASDAQCWDCYGYDFTVLEYDYLRGLDCKAMAGAKEEMGSYLFTVAPVADAFSAYPEQAKEFVFIKLDNGRLTIQPTNNVVFRELSFTSKDLDFPKGVKRQTEIYTAE